MKIQTNIIRFKYVVILFFSLTMISCKEGKRYSKKSTKYVIEYFSNKKMLKNIDLDDFINKHSINVEHLNKFKILDKNKLQLLDSELDKFPVFRGKFLKNPALVKAYRLVYDNPAVRTESKYLEQISKQLAISPNVKPTIIIKNNYNSKNVGKYVNNVFFKEVTIDMGAYKIKGVFPDFAEHSLFKTTLNKKYHIAYDIDHFILAKKDLREAYLKNPEKIISKLKELNKGEKYEFGKVLLSGDAMLKKQIDDILDTTNNNLFGFIWHHNENLGVMELVKTSVHNNVKHVGGKQIWGGGAHYR